MARARAKAGNGEEDVGRAAIALYMAEPFFAHVLQGMPRRIDEATPTAAVALVGNGIELRVNPAFFASLTRDERVAVIKHEVLHVILKHLLRTQGRDPQLWNLACDVVVNDLIGKWCLPEGAITRATFPDLELPEDLTAEEVYARLRNLANEAKGRSKKGNSPQSAEALKDAMSEGNEQSVGGHSDHSAWDGRAGREKEAGTGTLNGAAAADALVDGLLTRASDRTGSSWGDLPGAIRDAVQTARERGRPKVDWRRTLRIFSASAGRTRLVTTTRRESARYGNSAFLRQTRDPHAPTKERLVPGTKIKRLHTLLVAVDTSGSIGPEQLALFFNEIDSIWRSGANVLVVSCDAAVQESFEYTGRAPTKMGGGGGTAFEPVFIWMREQRGRRFDGVVYLTDGEGPAPETRPPCKLLWVVTSASGVGEHLRWGRRILLG